MLAMQDQANELRQRFRSAVTRSPREPRMIAFSGGRIGVGTTTVAVNVAVALAQQGRRVVLIDADPSNAAATEMCQLDCTHGSLGSVLVENRSIHEVLERGPAGVLLLPGSADSFSADAASYQWLVGQCRGLGLYADAVLFDLGVRTDEMSRCIWQSANLLVAVTTPEVQTVMDTYAAIKTLVAGDAQRTVYTMVNRATGSEVAQQVHARLAETARRFLGLSTRLAGFVPNDGQLEHATTSSRPLVLQSPRSDGARALDRLAETLWVLLSSSTACFDQRGAASEDFAPAAGYGPVAA
jgi:flagellar biosynthesis protein FlhG